MKKVTQIIQNKIFDFKRRFLYPPKTKILSESEKKDLLQSNNRFFEHSLTLSDICFDKNTDKKILAKKLNENGIIVIDNFLPQVLAKAAGEELKSFLTPKQEKLKMVSAFEDESCYCQIGHTRLKNYNDFANYHKPALLLRNQAREMEDGGMLDLFGVDKMIHNYAALKECIKIQQAYNVFDIIQQQMKHNIKEHQLNCYLNQSVTHTRGLHLDGIGETYKYFIYLTDVQELADGPYSFVPRSHSNRKVLMQNMLTNQLYKNYTRPEDILLSEQYAIPVLGKAGTLVLSNQNGIHKGYSQLLGRERIALVKIFF